MRIFRLFTTWFLVLGLAAPAVAGDLAANVGKVVEQQESPARPAATSRQPISKAFLWPGAALFAGGMVVGMNGFLNNRNGEFPEFGEADSTNVAMGVAGLAAAVGGGMLLFLGKRRAVRMSSVSVAPGRVSAAARLSW
jgi:hypothetical protein